MPDIKQSLRVFHLRASNFYGGPERQLHMHAIKAAQAGLTITVGSFMENSNQPEFLNVIAGDDIETRCFNVSNAYDPRSIGDIRRYLKNREIDILCTHDYRTHILGFLATRGLACRWIAFSRGATTENFKVRFFHALAGFIVRRTDHIVAVSGSEKTKLRRSGVNEDKITVVHNAIDIPRIRTATRADLRSRFNLARDSIVCVSAGRFSSEKGQNFLIKAAVIASNQNQKLRFVLFGDGPDLEKIRTTIIEMGFQDRILCPGFERSILGCLRDADILINPSLSEGLPNVVLEAMALGIPVIATAVGGVPELIHHNESGILVPPSDERALANAILGLLENWSQHDHLIEAAVRTIEESYSFDRQLKDLSAVYYGLMQEKGNSIKVS